MDREREIYIYIYIYLSIYLSIYLVGFRHHLPLRRFHAVRSSGRPPARGRGTKFGKKWENHCMAMCFACFYYHWKSHDLPPNKNMEATWNDESLRGEGVFGKWPQKTKMHIYAHGAYASQRGMFAEVFAECRWEVLDMYLAAKFISCHAFFSHEDPLRVLFHFGSFSLKVNVTSCWSHTLKHRARANHSGWVSKVHSRTR